MSLFSLNLEENREHLTAKDAFSVFKHGSQEPSEIHSGMTPHEIAEIVSEHFIEVVKKQFEAAKRDYREKQPIERPRPPIRL